MQRVPFSKPTTVALEAFERPMYWRLWLSVKVEPVMVAYWTPVMESVTWPVLMKAVPSVMMIRSLPAPELTESPLPSRTTSSPLLPRSDSSPLRLPK